MISNAQIKRAIAPISKALLAGGNLTVKFEGYKLSGSRSYPCVARPGPAWFVCITAERDGEWNISGSPAEVAQVLWYRLNKIVPGTLVYGVHKMAPHPVTGEINAGAR